MSSFASKLHRFMPYEVYPLVGAVVVGCSLSAYAIHHHLYYNPDVSLKAGYHYAFERYATEGDIKTPHFRFLEGKLANDRKYEFLQKKLHEEKH